MEEAFALLTCNEQAVNEPYNDKKTTPSATKLRDFIHEEIDRLLELRGLLTGSIPMDYHSLANLIDECDYLWAHFPDYAASSRCPDKTELKAGGPGVVSFLNRVRAEIDPFIKLWAMGK
jgi:hypothetical protein